MYVFNTSDSHKKQYKRKDSMLLISESYAPCNSKKKTVSKVADNGVCAVENMVMRALKRLHFFHVRWLRV